MARSALPAAWQLDAGTRYQNRLIGKLTQWSLHVENLTDRQLLARGTHAVLGRHLPVPLHTAHRAGPGDR
jgi:hypothetical protein